MIESANDIRGIEWDQIKPDNNNDWLNQRDKNYLKYTSLASDNSVSSIFHSHAMGIITNRDPWVYGFDSSQVKKM